MNKSSIIESFDKKNLIIVSLISFLIGIISVDSMEERSPGLIVFGICLVVGLVWVKKSSTLEQLRFSRNLFLYAFFIRVLFSVLITYAVDYGVFAEDEFYYAYMGEAIANEWKNGNFGDPNIALTVMGREFTKVKGYVYFSAIFYYVFGVGSLALKVFNCFIGAMSVFYFMKFSWAAFGEETGRKTGIYCCVFPSLILWSCLALKDPISIFCIIYLVWLTYCCREKIDVLTLLKIVVFMLILGQIRDYMFLLIGSCIGLSFVLRGNKNYLRNYAIGFVMIFIGFFILREFEYGQTYVDQMSFESLNTYRQSLATGNSAIHVDADISSPGKAASYLPIGVAYFLFAPFPWSIQGFRQLFALPEVLVWYGMFFFFIKGMIYAFKEKFALAAPSISILVLVTITYSLVEGNLGTAYRHRAQIFGFYLLFSAVGFVQSRAKKKSMEKVNETQILSGHSLIRE